ncbi:DUF1615 domain-containing protein [soil metagenome]
MNHHATSLPPLVRHEGGRFRTAGWPTGFITAAAFILAGCAGPQPAVDTPVPPRPAEVRAQIVKLLPTGVADKDGWATDIYAAFASMNIFPSNDNVCAVLAVTEQESSFRADPAVPKLPDIAWGEIHRRAEKAGVPKLLVDAALRISSPNGKSYSERIDTVRNERELSDTFEDFIGMVPMGQRLFAGYNPIRTGGPMQVGIAFAQRQARDKGYPYPVAESIRREVFTRRGGMYFGIAHLLDYPAVYDRLVYRFADFNAGRYASRNAAFQNAVSVASGIPLALDGDLIRFDGDSNAPPGTTELAVRSLRARIDMNDAAIRRDLELGDKLEFDDSKLHRRVFELADALDRRAVPRAMLPRIDLESPKITRKLSTEWFANRVDERQRRCMAKIAAP